MSKTWKDQNGEPLFPGDIIFNLETMTIGTIIWKYGLPAMRIEREFNRNTMNMEIVPLKATDEAYIRDLVKKKYKSLWWWRQNYCIPDIEVIQHVQERHRRSFETMTTPSFPAFEAPTPWF